MSIVRRRKRYYIWIILAAILLLVLLVCFWSISRLKLKEHGDKIIKMYVLNSRKEEGDELGERDLRIVKMKGRELCYSVKKSALIGKTVKFNLEKGTVLDECMVYDKADSDNGLRKISYSYIRQTGKLSKGDYVDVRISFPNGADFIILAKKKVLNISEEPKEQGEVAQKLYFTLSEEEIMRMSSGVVDAYLTDSAYIYTVQYIDSMQAEAVVNYPVNEIVEKLIQKDPNIVKTARDAVTTELRSKIYDSLQGQEEDVDAICNEDGLTYFE